MKDILYSLSDSLSKGNYLVGAVIVIVALIFNIQKIVGFFEERKKAKISKLTEALKCEHIQGVTKTFLEEELANEHFKLSTGIRLEKKFREALIQVYTNSKSGLSFIHYKRSLPQIVFKNTDLSVQISIIERVGFLINIAGGLCLIILGILLLNISEPQKGITIIQLLREFGVSCFFLSVAFLMLYQTFPVISALKIKKELKRSHNNANAADAKSSAAD